MELVSLSIPESKICFTSNTFATYVTKYTLYIFYKHM